MKGELYVLLEGQNRGMPEAVAFHPSLAPVHRSIKRCELYAEKQRMALRQKLAAIRHTQLTASATTTAAARLCAIGEAMGCNLSRFHLSGRGGFDLRAGGFWRNAKKPIVNALNLWAYLPPIELGNYGRARVGSQFRGKRIAIVIWHNECIVQMAYTFGRTRKANDWFAC